METRVVVIGGGVAALCGATHLLELWAARDAAGLPPARLDLTLLTPLSLDDYGDGSGLGGKAMSRTFEGRIDPHGWDRQLFYGPMMPHKGVVPHGYHVLWAYPNLRRMLGAGEPDEPSPKVDGGLLRPPGGAGEIAIFQGNLDDPSPGGPGIARMGLSDPDDPASATRPATQALYRLQGTAFGRIFLRPFLALFAGGVEAAFDGIHPLFFADLFYTHEVDLEMRLALIAASLQARTTDPERTTLSKDGEDRPLWAVEYTDWLESNVFGWARSLVERLSQPPLSELQEELSARAWLLEAQLETEVGLLSGLKSLLPDALEQDLDDALLVLRETERVLRGVPAAALRLASGAYPVGRTLHLRFGPDGTFTSPYSFDAAQALRSLAFVFTSPRSARAWTPDGAKIQRLWVRLWTRLRALADAHPDTLKLTIEKGRAHEIAPAADGASVIYGDWLGHGTGVDAQGKPTYDLGMPYTFQTDVRMPPPANLRALPAHAVLSGVPPAHLIPLLPSAPQIQQDLAPLASHTNATLEILVWTRERIQYAPAVAAALAESSITGLEGGFCLLADYSQGLWSEGEYQDEDPFHDGAFSGSILESCGGFDDLFAALSRPDAWGWPDEVKTVLRDLLARPEHFQTRDARPWTADESGWEQKRAGGTWTDARQQDPEAAADWWVAARWLCWQFLRQLAGVQSLGPRAVRQFEYYARLVDPRRTPRSEILQPPEALRGEIRYVVMINAKARNRIFSPAAGLWPLRPMSGAPLAPGSPVWPAGDWTRNGLDIVCMEATCLSAMRAARGIYADTFQAPPPEQAPQAVPVLPKASWYAGLDPLARPGEPVGGR